MNHRWNLEAKIPAHETPDYIDRTERTCPYNNVPFGCVANGAQLQEVRG